MYVAGQLGLPEVQQQHNVAVSRLLELADHEFSGPGGSPPVNPAAAVAAPPGSNAVEVAVGPGLLLPPVGAGKRVAMAGDPAAREPSQAGKNHQPFDLARGHGVAEQAEGKSRRQPQRAQLIAAAPGNRPR